MNKIISIKERVFISLIGPSGSEKPHLIFDWLKIGTFQPKFDKIFIFININDLFMEKCKENTLNSSKELTLN